MINGPRTQVVVTFDKALIDVPGVILANWEMRFNNLDYTMSVGIASGTTITFAVAAGVGDPGIDRVDFTPPPFDVLTLENNRPVVAFTDFPLTG